MNKRAIWVSFFSLALLAACEKPSESDCKRAVVNILRISSSRKRPAATSCTLSNSTPSSSTCVEFGGIDPGVIPPMSA